MHWYKSNLAVQVGSGATGVREPTLTQRVDQDAMAEMMKIASQITPGDESRTFIALPGLRQAVSAGLLGPQMLVQVLVVPTMPVHELKQHLTTFGVDLSKFFDKESMQEELKQLIYRSKNQHSDNTEQPRDAPAPTQKIGLLRKKSSEGNITKDESEILRLNDEVHCLKDLQRARSESLGNYTGAHGEEPESQSYIKTMVEKKLTDPDMVLTINESLQCLDHCIRLGQRGAQEAQGKDVLVVLGHTGAGKSTFINYVHGCTLARADKAIVVSPSSPVPELMKIGTSLVSQTFIPDVREGQELVFVDCPVNDVSLSHCCSFSLLAGLW